MSIITEDGERRVRMAHLAVIGSHHVNGVAQLHTELMRRSVFAGFADLYPERFVNVTNGIAVRRWLKQSNPGLSALLTQRLGFAWENDLEELGRLAGAADEPEFLRHFRGIKRTNKQRLAEEVMRRTGVELDVDSMFDVQVKRIHEYKRQLLNLLYVVARYQRIRRDPRRCGAANGDVRRQGGARILHGEGDREAHQQRRAHDQRRARDRASACGSCFCRITTCRLRRRSCRPRISRSRSRPPEWRPPAPAT